MQASQRLSSVLIGGGVNQKYGKFSDSLIGVMSNSPNFSNKKKNIPTKQFLTSPFLLKKYGFWSDTDKDGVLNGFDCFPFDRKRQDVAPSPNGVVTQDNQQFSDEEIQKQQDLYDKYQQSQKELNQWEQARFWVESGKAPLNYLPAEIRDKAYQLQKMGLRSFDSINAENEYNKQQYQKFINLGEKSGFMSPKNNLPKDAGFITNSGKVIGGEFGRLLAQNNPDRAVSMSSSNIVNGYLVQPKSQVNPQVSLTPEQRAISSFNSQAPNLQGNYDQNGKLISVIDNAKAVSRQPTFIETAANRPIDRTQTANNYFSSYARGNYVTNLNNEIKRFIDEGYSEKEAFALAQYTSSTNSSPNRQVTKEILNGVEYGYSWKDIKSSLKTKGLFPTVEYYTSKPVVRFANNAAAEYEQDVGRFIPSRFRNYTLSLGIPNLVGFTGLNNLLNVRFSDNLDTTPSRPYNEGNNFALTSLNNFKNNINNGRPTITPTNSTQSGTASGTINKGNTFGVKNFLVGNKGIPLASFSDTDVVRTAADVASYGIPYYGTFRLGTQGVSLFSRAAAGTYNTIKDSGVKAVPSTFVNYALNNPGDILMGGLMLAGGSYKAYKYANEPKTIFARIGNEAPSITGFGTVINTNEETAKGIFQVRLKDPNSYMTVKTTRFRDYFGLTPKQVIIRDGAEFTTKVPAILTDSGESIAFAETMRTSANNPTLKRFNEIRGATQEINPEELSKLTPEERYVSNQLFKKEPTVFNSESETNNLFIGSGRSRAGRPIDGNQNTRLMKVSSGGAESRLLFIKPTISEVDKSITASKVLLVTEGDGFREYLVKSSQKNTKSINPKAGGKVSFSQLLVRVEDKAAPIIEDSSSGYSVLSPNQKSLQRIKEQKLAAQLAQRALESNPPKLLAPKVKTPKLSGSTRAMTTSLNSARTPLILGSAGQVPSMFYSRGNVNSNENYNAGKFSLSINNQRPKERYSLFLTGLPGQNVSAGYSSTFNNGFTSGFNQGNKNISGFGLGISSNSDLSQNQGSGFNQGEGINFGSGTGEKQETDSGLDRPNPFSPSIPIPTPDIPIPKKTIRKTPRIYLPGEKDKSGIEKAYDAYIYIDATKGKKARYEKINNAPLNQMSALSAVAREVDQGIEARGKITPTKPKIVNGKKVIPKALNTNDKYFQTFSYKFRNYSGKARKPLPTGTIIERQKYRLDNPNETKTIQTSRKRRTPFGF